MAIASISSWRTPPERRREFLSRIAEARRFHERHGGRVRVWNNAVAGDDVGVVEYWIEHEDWEAYGRFTAALASDPEYQAWFAGFTGERPSGHVVATRLAHTID